ncbi:uncharacterized protein LOC119829360 [Zerene cesonia]|uniref:uncharacterized protein LOC119829360 n=1 Tax=Zerene cesonia TaxID=33412 RepID=UPI0018E5174C|nr:uncharacterized protein LOC119829360 [Zerene cesonia]
MIFLPVSKTLFYTLYERKYGHNLPTDTVKPHFEALPGIPCGIFRCTGGEILGRGADKCCLYKNPEYFSYHHMTFFDLHLYLRPCRQPSPVSGRKK